MPAGSVPPLPGDEQRCEHEKDGQQPPPARVIVGRTGGEQERPHQREHRDTEKDHADRIERDATPGMDASGGQHPDRRGDGGDSQRNVHPEDPAPAVIRTAQGDHEPSERRAECRCQPDRRSEQAERTPAFCSLEDLLNQAEHLGHLDAGSHSLQQPEDHEHDDVWGQRAREAREREQDEAHEEQCTTRSLVAEAPHGNQEQTEGQDVARDDQLKLGGTGAQSLFDRRQCNVDLR